MNGDNPTKTAAWGNVIMLVGVVIAAWAFLIKPIEERVAHNDQTIAALGDKIEVLNAQIYLIREKVAADNSDRVAKEAEIETQFDADSQLRNIQFSDQQRLNAILWNALGTMGTYPTAPYFQPNISRRNQ
ncbi:MAG TPA: hypothetical protein VLK33_08175 [Terriglobales bacterium]|nr:hypothetical protein [Terriglobales bacterium]